MRHLTYQSFLKHLANFSLIMAKLVDADGVHILVCKGNNAFGRYFYKNGHGLKNTCTVHISNFSIKREEAKRFPGEISLVIRDCLGQIRAYIVFVDPNGEHRIVSSRDSQMFMKLFFGFEASLLDSKAIVW